MNMNYKPKHTAFQIPPPLTSLLQRHPNQPDCLGERDKGSVLQNQQITLTNRACLKKHSLAHTSQPYLMEVIFLYMVHPS